MPYRLFVHVVSVEDGREMHHACAARVLSVTDDALAIAESEKEVAHQQGRYGLGHTIKATLYHEDRKVREFLRPQIVYWHPQDDTNGGGMFSGGGGDSEGGMFSRG